MKNVIRIMKSNYIARNFGRSLVFGFTFCLTKCFFLKKKRVLCFHNSVVGIENRNEAAVVVRKSSPDIIFNILYCCSNILHWTELKHAQKTSFFLFEQIHSRYRMLDSESLGMMSNQPQQQSKEDPKALGVWWRLWWQSVTWFEFLISSIVLVVQQLADFREIRELGSTYKSSKT